MNTSWQLPPPALLEDDNALADAAVHLYRALYRDHFGDLLTINHALPVETRALRRESEWRLFLLLTPWMLTRVLVPGSAPDVDFPPETSLAECEARDPVVLGPTLTFRLGNSPQKAHLSYHPLLGHYLLQPLVLAMESYRSADEVYAAWNDVIRTRNANMQRLARSCAWQEEVSRREFLQGLRRHS